MGRPTPVGTTTRVAVAGGCTIEVPDDWVVVSGQPLVVMPRRWEGEPPAVVIQREDGELQGARLAGAVLAASERLDDPVVLDLRLDGRRRDVEVLVAHRSRGVAVTTLERHRCDEDGRWVVAFTAADVDWVDLAALATRVVASIGGPA